LSALLHRHPRLRLGLLLGPPMLWLGVAYLGALAALFLTSLWSVNEFTGAVQRTWSLDNYRELLTQEVYRTITLRTLGIAVFVTIADALLAVPIAFYMAKIASPRAQKLLVIAVLTPLWASYLVKAYSWRAMFSATGPIAWVLEPFGLSSPGYGLTATVVTLTYLWLPYMILPVYAGLERLPNSLLEASADLGAGSWPTLRRVVLPVMFPALIAGSIFTFSLTLGDYIAVEIVGGTNQMLGNVVYDVFLTANNMPFAAAVSTIPVVIMTVYLLGVRRSGAVENL
jgi:putative spermidine/putrescine transport system permease protein